MADRSIERSIVDRGAGSGFTLIELLVVLALIALLLTIALPRYFGSLDRSKETVLKENLKVLRTTLDKFQADTGQYPEVLDELVAKQYLRAVPVDPVTESATTWVIVPHQNPEVRGIFDVRSGAQGKSRGGVPFGEM